MRFAVVIALAALAVAASVPAASTRTATLQTDSACMTPTTPSAGTTPPTTATKLGPTPTGVVAFQIFNPNKAPFASLFPAGSSSGMLNLFAGVDLLAGWCTIEPTQNHFDWGPLDTLFQQADANGKYVILTLIPGFATPPWALTKPTPVPMVTSSFSYAGPITKRELPQPWNRTYLKRWYMFLAQVAARYGRDPAFRGIAAGGPTSVSTEMSLPDWPSSSDPTLDKGLPATLPGSTVALNDNDFTMWEQWGYTPNTLVTAWTAAFQHYRKLFPDQYVMLALFPGLTIGNSGTTDNSQWVATPLSVTSAGETALKSQFVLMEDGIQGTSVNPTDPMYNIVKAGCSGAVTAYQDAITMPTDQTHQTLALQNVAAADVDFWEVNINDFTPDDPVLEKAMTDLPTIPACAPLKLSIESDGLGNYALHITSNIDPDNSGLQVNLFENGRPFSLPCTTTASGVTCAGDVTAGGYTADIGEPGTEPYTAQALASAKIVDTHVTKPGCKASGCH